jgi:hypothetical protein
MHPLILIAPGLVDAFDLGERGRRRTATERRPLRRLALGACLAVLSRLS